MPKLKKQCRNPLHDEWSVEEEDWKLVNLRARGLAELWNIFKTFFQIRGFRPSKLGERICSICLKRCFEKPEFLEHMTPAQCTMLKKKVSLVNGM